MANPRTSQQVPNAKVIKSMLGEIWTLNHLALTCVFFIPCQHRSTNRTSRNAPAALTLKWCKLLKWHNSSRQQSWTPRFVCSGDHPYHTFNRTTTSVAREVTLQGPHVFPARCKVFALKVHLGLTAHAATGGALNGSQGPREGELTSTCSQGVWRCKVVLT